MAGAVRLRLGDESGSIVNAPAALLMFLVFLLIAVQVSLHLFAVSTTTAIAFDVGRKVAAAGTASTYTCDDAEAEAEGRFGRWDGELDVDCRGDGTDGGPPQDQITVRVFGQSPAQVLAGFGSIAGIDTFDRVVTVRRELFQ